MAPKKIEAKTEKVAKGRPGRPKETKEKPKLKTPTVVKIKIPVKNITRTIQNKAVSSDNIFYKKPKQLSENDKLELSNKVASAQLNKSDPVVFPAEPSTEVKVVKKRGRKKAEVTTEREPDDLWSPTAVTGSSDSEGKGKEQNGQQTKRKNVRKSQPIKEAEMSPTKKMAVNPALNPKKGAGRTVKRKLPNSENTQEHPHPPKRKWTQSRIADLKILVRRNAKASANGDKPRSVAVKRPQLTRKRVVRGKKNIQAKSQEGSPSILDPPPDISQDVTDGAIKKEQDDGASNAGVVDSRKASMTSELSWTKDISDSSNTTTMIDVRATDIVLIDNKLPELKLVKLKSKPEVIEPIETSYKEFTPKTPSDSSSSDSDSSDSESSSCDRCDLVSRHSLNLSTSTESHRSPIITQKNISITTINNVNKLSRALDKLSQSLKKIDLEMINWVGYQNEGINPSGKKLGHKIHQNLQEESNIILQCRQLNRILTDDNVGTVNKDVESDVKNNELFVKPNKVAVPKSLNKSDHFNDKGNHSRDPDFTEDKYDFNDKLAPNNIAYIPYDQYFDDEDALSLYAESIGLESNRNSISSPPHFNPEVEEYIPQPLVTNVQSNTVYNPTKIVNSQQIEPLPPVQNVRAVPTVCEKQNADSTSVVKGPNQIVNAIDDINKSPVPARNPVMGTQMPKFPSLFSKVFKALPAAKSSVFKGMCFFHLIASCKNQTRCRFPHVEPDPVEIYDKLNKLSEETFIHEYMLLKCWPGLRRKYGHCFLNECKRRDLTRLLVEMAIDYVMKANMSYQEDLALKLYVLEEVLMHLNNIDLDTCEDLLLYPVQGRQLCDLFMETIANTQNFTRFRPVFIKLTQFVIEKAKVFSLEVASHILERVAILPFNESLAWALLSIIKHTDVAIFENMMMGQFEKQVCANEGLHREFLMVKAEAWVSGGLAGVGVIGGPAGAVGSEGPAGAGGPCREGRASPRYELVQRYTSPDTTHLDTLSKPPEEPVITRTVNFPHAPYSSSSNESAEEHPPRTPKPKSLFQSWRNKSIFNNITPQRFPMRRMDRQVTYGANPNIPRRPGPNFY